MTAGPLGVAVVTGGSRGIGRAICLRLGQEGFTVVLNYRRDHDAAEEVRSRMLDLGFPEPTLIQADVSDVNAAKSLFCLVRERFGHLSVLVNNAGSRAD